MQNMQQLQENITVAHPHGHKDTNMSNWNHGHSTQEKDNQLQSRIKETCIHIKPPQ